MAWAWTWCAATSTSCGAPSRWRAYEGSGTTLRIRLPLTLAIIDGFRVEVAGASYVVPLDMVIECLDLGPFLESEENHLINLRGEVLPFLRLREVFRLPGGDARPGSGSW